MSRSAPQLEAPVAFGGRYTMIKALATGGMAEIYLARQESLPGFDKLVVIKRLLERYRGDNRVREMFFDEARIGAILNHPHIVHVYDVGEHEGIPFIAMEFIDGMELATLCRRGVELESFLPLEHAVELMRQAAEGLGYFHAVRDDEAKRLEIVHRDVSPSNLLITREGVLKVIDFGVARSRMASSHDDLVPGKYNYMAPEQIRGERVDQRADIFSLGIVLYEITVGRRLFKGPAEEVIQKITSGQVKPPTFIRRDFPPDLETIVMRSLELHAADRYQTGYELAADLETFLREHALPSSQVRIAQYLAQLDVKGGGSRRPELEIAGEAWLDDLGEEALDFDRPFAQMKKEVAAALSGDHVAAPMPPSPTPPPVTRAEVLPAPAAVPEPAAAPAPTPAPPPASAAPTPSPTSAAPTPSPAKRRPSTWGGNSLDARPLSAPPGGVPLWLFLIVLALCVSFAAVAFLR